MPQLIVRNVENQLKVRLQHRAKRDGRSMQEEVRETLRNALREEHASSIGLGTEIAALFRDQDLEDDIPEIRGHVITPSVFER